MRFGINFFPTVAPSEKSGAAFYDECLELCELVEALGYHHVKTVEHYFFPWGGYSPDPVTFLAAAAQRTRRVRLVTGAVVPAFNHPIKLAGKLAMLDNLSHGRLDVGFARAFLPDEFEAFQTSMGESRARFEEGIEAVRRLWTEEEFRFSGTFHQFGPHPALLPRPCQQPHPPIFVAATFNPVSFDWSGRMGYHLMIVPQMSTHSRVAALVARYRTAWAEAGHRPGAEQVHLTCHCYLSEDSAEARRRGKALFEDYKAKQLQAISAWSKYTSDQYPGYEHLVAALEQASFEAGVADQKLLVGDPDEVAAQLEVIRGHYGDVEPSLLVNFGDMPKAEAVRTTELFATHVMPRFASGQPERC
jgi:alkanesulfonate monooxygenase SsuD/methylene tetrahydromethanopterin reductase-like flavin-dependent oxidoreductase (luciferase family)